MSDVRRSASKFLLSLSRSASASASQKGFVYPKPSLFMYLTSCLHDEYSLHGHRCNSYMHAYAYSHNPAHVPMQTQTGARNETRPCQMMPSSHNPQAPTWRMMEGLAGALQLRRASEKVAPFPVSQSRTEPTDSVAEGKSLF
jgi:hypothetical protein